MGYNGPPRKTQIKIRWGYVRALNHSIIHSLSKYLWETYYIQTLLWLLETHQKIKEINSLPMRNFYSYRERRQ